jgi:ATP-dependent DNA helicase PIF1
MVRPDVLDGVDQFLRLNRGVDAPFGGVQILLVGDLFQLPPVVPEEERRALRQLNYSTDFFFSAAGIADSPLVPVVLQRVFRQTDAAFIALLNDLREGRRVSEALRAINERCVGPGDVVGQELMLTSTNHVADERNLQELSRLASASRTYVGTVTGEFRVETTRLPAPANLEVKVGAQVMFTKNDDRKRWVNGTIGRVVELGTRTIKVTLDRESSRETFEVEPVTWEQYRYRYNEAKECIEREVVGKYQQLPLMLAWAVTIHKAQGKTLDRIFVDLGSGAFSPGTGLRGSQ